MNITEFVQEMPEITQDNFRILIPGKIARVVSLIQQQDGGTVIEAMLKFYNSKTYSLLERERTKTWYMSAWQLFQEYQQE